MLSKLTAPLPEFGWDLLTNEICRHFIDLMLKDSDWKSMSKYYLNLLYQMISCNSLQKYFIFLWRITRGWMLHSDTSGLVSMPSSSQIFSISFRLLAVLPLIAKVIVLSMSDMLFFIYMVQKEFEHCIWPTQWVFLASQWICRRYEDFFEHNWCSKTE